MKHYNGSEFVKENYDPAANDRFACNYSRDPTDGWGVFTKSELAERSPYDQDFYNVYGAGVVEGFDGSVLKKKWVKWLGYLLLTAGLLFAVWSLMKCSKGRKTPMKSSRSRR